MNLHILQMYKVCHALTRQQTVHHCSGMPFLHFSEADLGHEILENFMCNLTWNLI